jgi:hypothetical protein
MIGTMTFMVVICPKQLLHKKIFQVGYHWHSLFHNCSIIVKWCEAFQLFATKACTSPSPLHRVVSIRPSTKWESHLTHFCPSSSDVHKSIIVVVNYFMKWNEAMQTFLDDGYWMTHLFFNHIIFRFNIPK